MTSKEFIKESKKLNNAYQKRIIKHRDEYKDKRVSSQQEFNSKMSELRNKYLEGQKSTEK